VKRILKRTLPALTILAAFAGIGVGTSAASASSPLVSFVGANLTAVSCPSTSHCWAVGTTGEILATNNGGSTWFKQRTPSGVTQLEGVSCPSTNVCVAVSSAATRVEGGTILVTKNGGRSWAVHTSATALAGVTCPSTEDCVAVGGSTIVTTANGGTTWVTRKVPQPVTELGGVSCPSKDVCLAVGGATSGEQGSVDFAVTTNGVKTWKARVAAYGTGADFSGVSCPSTQECFAVGGDILATKNGGATWADQTAVLQALFLAVSCPSSNACFAVGTSSFANDVIYATTKGGRAWKQSLSMARSGPIALNGVSCHSTKDCVAVGGSVIVETTNAGATWERSGR
jgi:photosystem II stability/assembly factor-like uncharacterized protein